jgi:hypothetical protein
MPVLYLITVIAISIAIVLRLTNPEEIATLGMTGFAGISLFFCVALAPVTDQTHRISFSCDCDTAFLSRFVFGETLNWGKFC